MRVYEGALEKSGFGWLMPLANECQAREFWVEIIDLKLLARGPRVDESDYNYRHPRTKMLLFDRDGRQLAEVGSWVDARPISHWRPTWSHWFRFEQETRRLFYWERLEQTLARMPEVEVNRVRFVVEVDRSLYGPLIIHKLRNIDVNLASRLKELRDEAARQAAEAEQAMVTALQE